MTKLTILAVLVGLVLTVTPTMAAQHTGTIERIHLNTTVSDRGVCVRTTPTGPGTGWFCLWEDTHLYQETTAVLRDAYTNFRACLFNWHTTDPHGHNLINLLECY